MVVIFTEINILLTPEIKKMFLHFWYFTLHFKSEITKRKKNIEVRLIRNKILKLEIFK